MHRLISTAAGFVAFVFASGAAAAPITFSEGSGTVFNPLFGDVLGPGSAVSFNVQDIENGASGSFSFTGSFENQATMDALGSATVIAFQPTALASINNLSMRFFDNVGFDETVNVTNAAGEPIGLTGFDVQFLLSIASAASEVFVTVTGEAVSAQLTNLDPGLQVQLSQIPGPAALPLLASGLIGLGFAMRRRKKIA